MENYFVTVCSVACCTVSKCNFIQLLYVLDVVDCKAFLEIFRQFLYVLLIAKWQDDSVYVVVLACS